MTPVLHVDRLYRFFRAGDEEVLALQGVSFDLHAGETVAVVGPSGSGKSTLLSCVTGLDEPSGGSVWLDGVRLSHRSEAVRARMRGAAIGLLAQQRNLVPHLTVLGNVALAQRLGAGRRRATVPAAPAAREVLDQVGIGDRWHAYPEQLSGGEGARAGLAVALANGPRVIVADEPTGELDETTEQVVLDLLRRSAAAGSAVLVASHSAAVRRSADRELVLENGALTS
ncbi:MAG: ABC transporter ATP-binding protein [Nocardioides sp.]